VESADLVRSGDGLWKALQSSFRGEEPKGRVDYYEVAEVALDGLLRRSRKFREDRRRTDVLKNLQEAVAELKRDGSRPVRTRIDDLTVEIHVVQEPLTGQKAADLFGEIGPWEGESTEEIMGLLSEARRRGGRREVRDL
jgi:hypothetical protein